MSESFGKRIRTQRGLLKLTQKEVGIRLGVAESTVRMWELDRNEPDFAMVVKMCKLFDCTLNDLLLDGALTEKAPSIDEGARILRNVMDEEGFSVPGEPLTAEQVDAFRRMARGYIAMNAPLTKDADEIKE